MQGIFNRATGTTFLIGPALDRVTAPAVLLHEMIHSQQADRIDARAMAMIDGRASEKDADLRAFLDRVAARMESVGATTDPKEAAAYIVEEAVIEGRSNGYRIANSQFFAWADKALGEKVGALLRSFAMMVRTWMVRHGVVRRLTVDDLVGYAMAGLGRAAGGAVEVSGQNAAASVSDAEVRALVAQYAGVQGAPTDAQLREAVRQYRETEAAYGGREAFERAKADGKTKLNYHQWVQVRTPNFKRWFGDWEIGGAKTQRDATTFAEAREQAKAFQGKPLTNGATGIVATVSRNSLDKMLSSKAVGKSESPATHSLAVANLDQLFERAMLGWSKPDSEGDPNIKAIHRFFAPVMVGGRAMLAKMTVKETAQESKANPLYSVEAISFEKMEGPAAQWVGEIAGADGIDPRTIRSAGLVESMAQRVQEFNPDTVSKVTDPETGEPMVVYHGTRGDFSVFSEGEIGSATDRGFAGPAFYFTNNAESASSYAEPSARNQDAAGGNVMPVYLKIERPYYVPEGQDTLTPEQEQEAHSGRYDGIINRLAEDDGYVEYAVFRPEQIKSAIGNIGTFDGESPDIRFSRSQTTGTTGVTRSDLRAAFKRRMPGLSEALDAMLERGEKGQKGGLVLIDSSDPLQIARAFAEKTGRSLADAERSVRASIRAWHGSPHRFDRFSTEAIGTGEGAQVYGWGLYFADSRDVAEYYRTTLGNRDSSGYASAHLNAQNIVARFNNDAEWAAEVVREQLNNTPENDPNHQRLQDTLTFIEDGGYARPLPQAGALYQVELAPTEDQYLLWDKPLSEQSETVRTALRKAGLTLSAEDAAEIGRIESSAPKIDNLFDMLEDDSSYRVAQIKKGKFADEYTGGQAYGDLKVRMGDKAASEYLHSIGIRGIKYLDGASRDGSGGSFNYVIFDDADVQILDVKYSRNGAIQGFYDPRSGLQFLIAPNVSAQTAPGVILHEAVHGRQDAQLDAKAMRLIQGRAKEQNRTLRSFLDRVAARMEQAGEADNAIEAMPYIVEQAVTEGRSEGHSAIDGKFMSWVDANIGKAVGNMIRGLVARLRAWVHQRGVPIKQFHVDDFVAVAKAAMRSAESGDVLTGGEQAVSASDDGVNSDIRFSRSTPPGAIEVDGVERPTTNSEGRPIHPTEDGIRNFWRWFGDSDMTEGDGAPTVFYHYGNEKIERMNGGGRFAGLFILPHRGAKGYGKVENALYFRGDLAYSKDLRAFLDEQEDGGVSVLSELAGVELDEDGADAVRKAILDETFEEGDVFAETVGAIDIADGTVILQRMRGELARKAGFGGVTIDDEFNGDSIMVVEPTAIKSATENIGAFDQNDPGVRFSRAGLDADTGGSAAWSDKRIDSLLREFGYDFDPNLTKAYAVRMRPDDFLKATTPKSECARLEEERGELDASQLAAETQSIYLTVEESDEEGVFNIKGHEGRHRMMALRDASVTSVPVVVIVRGEAIRDAAAI